MGRTLIYLGVLIALIGLAVQFGGQFGLGKLPGDITVKGEKYAFYFPLMTCIVISAAVSAIMWVIRRFF